MDAAPSPCEPVATIDLDRLAANYRLLARLVAPKRVICVVKGDAYGHGAIACARALQAAGAEAFAVSRISEGIALRRAGVRGVILVLGGIPLHDVVRCAARCASSALTPVLQSARAAIAVRDALDRVCMRLEVHLKIDTGLTRLGIDPDELPKVLFALRNDPFVRITGLCTHLAAADAVDTASVRLTARQVAAFERVVEAVGGDRMTHAEASAAALQGLVQAASHVRVGKALYGLIPAEPPWPRLVGLAPVLSLRTEVLQVREVAAGTAVGYGGRWVARRPSRLATIAIGFADGYPRSLSNRGFVVLRGHRAPLAGRVSMDLSVCDVTDVPGVSEGDEVVLLGTQAWESNVETVTACDLARAARTTPSRLTCCLSPRVRRVFATSTESLDVHVPGSVLPPAGVL